MRRFERIDAPRARDAVLPKRATAHSAGYDFVALNDIIVHAGGSFVATLRTGIKARMEPDDMHQKFAGDQVGAGAGEWHGHH